MSKDLLQKMRKVNRLLQRVGSDRVVFTDICKVLSDVLDSNVVVISNKNKILGVYSISQNKLFGDEYEEKGNYVDPSVNDQLLSVMEIKENVQMKEILADSNVNEGLGGCVLPIAAGGQRLGTLLIYKENGEYGINDCILGEYGATIVAVEMLRSLREENEMQERKITVVKSAIGTLSYSELEAILHIFEELDGEEGLLIASKIADRVGITRSVIVNALRKFESAGVIESRSLGMKGTYIKVLNDALIPELNKLRK